MSSVFENPAWARKAKFGKSLCITFVGCRTVTDIFSPEIMSFYQMIHLSTVHNKIGDIQNKESSWLNLSLAYKYPINTNKFNISYYANVIYFIFEQMIIIGRCVRLEPLCQLWLRNNLKNPLKGTSTFNIQSSSFSYQNFSILLILTKKIKTIYLYRNRVR